MNTDQAAKTTPRYAGGWIIGHGYATKGGATRGARESQPHPHYKGLRLVVQVRQNEEWMRVCGIDKAEFVIVGVEADMAVAA